MTVREFLGVIDGYKALNIYEQEDKILEINTRYIENVKKELLDREIKEHGVDIRSNYDIHIFLK